MLTRPLVPTLATTRPEMDVPVEKLSDDEFGAAEAAGQTARLPSLLGRAAVTLSSTESTPDGGTTEVPVTARSIRPPGARRPVGAPSPYRVSRRRVGVVVERFPNAGNQPTMSTRASVVWLTLRRMRPSLPTPTTAWLATTSPPSKFRVDEAAGELPDG